MAARTRKIRHDEETRKKIQASQLINALENHVIKGTDMTSTQVNAALGLLRKTLPDLSAATMEHSGNIGLAEILSEIDGRSKGIPEAQE